MPQFDTQAGDVCAQHRMPSHHLSQRLRGRNAHVFGEEAVLVEVTDAIALRVPGAIDSAEDGIVHCEAARSVLVDYCIFVAELLAVCGGKKREW